MDQLFLELALILVAAKVGGEICERWLHQPPVLAEIVIGLLLGTSGLHWIHAEDDHLRVLSVIGSILLLFEVGLECDLAGLLKVGREALFVAIAGSVLPFSAGFAICAVAGMKPIVSIFVGAALTATSVGITARVFSDLKALQSKEANIVLGAAVADDIIGLIVMALVTGLAASGGITGWGVLTTTLIALAFLVLSIVLGLRLTPYILVWARKMKTRAAVSSAAVAFCLFLSGTSHLAGLAPIVGAFAAGLVLAKAESKLHFEDNVRHIGELFVPIFFVAMGAEADLRTITPSLLGLSGLILVAALVGKVLAGLILPVRQMNRWLIGVGMMPRGEVGLIFAGVGLSRHIVPPDLYSALVLVIVATTVVTPPLLRLANRRGSMMPIPESV